MSVQRHHNRIIVPVLCLMLLVQVGLLEARNATGALIELQGLEIASGRNRAATAQYYNGDRDGAVAQLQRLHQEYPEDLDIALDLARLLRETGQFTAAVDTYQAISIRIDAAISTQNAAIKEAPSNESNNEETSRVRQLLIEHAENIEYELIRSLVLAGRSAEAVSRITLNHDNELQLSPHSQQLFWHGVALLELEHYEEALAAFEVFRSQVGHHPQALFQQATAQHALGDHQDAVRTFEAALRQDSSLTAALHPLARSYIALERYDSAYRLLQRAEISMPWNDTVRAERQDLVRLRPELLETEQAELVERTATVRAPQLSTFSTDRETVPDVRIGLAEGVQHLQARSSAHWVLEELNESRVISRLAGNSDELFTIQLRDDDRIEILNEAGEPLLRTGATVRIRYAAPELSTVLFDIEFGHGQFQAGREDRSYRGEIEFFRGRNGITVVNTVNMEEYLYSVVPSEMPAHWPEAALEAQAVAARSYTIAGMNGRYRERGFDLLSSVASHYYRGIGGEHPRTTAAVNATRGQVLMAEGRVLTAVYSANAAGYTESSASVWGNPGPLVAVSDKLLPDRDEPESPDQLNRWLESTPASYSNVEGLHSRSAYRWTLWVHRDEILHRNRTGNLGTVTAVTPLARGNSGRVEAVLIRGTDGAELVRRDAIRSRLGGLRSNLFMVEPKLNAQGEAEYFVFTGAGWGHGVGMCQTGAAGMAADGFTSEEILAHYYPRANLELRY